MPDTGSPYEIPFLDGTELVRAYPAFSEDLANAIVDGLDSAEGVPAGTLIWHLSSTAPSGYIKANGAAISRSTFADLFAAIGTTFGSGNGSTTFNLPDLRGEFLRGWDDGRGVDSGRSFGSSQLDQMQRITGNVGSSSLGRDQNRVQAGALSSVSATNRGNGASVANGIRIFFDSADSPDARTSSSTNGETRARNVALLPCVKF